MDDWVYNDFAKHWSIWRLIPEVEVDSILSPHTGHVVTGKLSACLNILCREVSLPGSDFLFLCPEDCSFCGCDGSFFCGSLSSRRIGQSVFVGGGIAAKLSNSFIWKPFILPAGLDLLGLLSPLWDDCDVPIAVLECSCWVLSGVLLSLSLRGFGWTEKKFLRETGGVSALARLRFLIGDCASITRSLADVGITMGSALLFSPYIEDSRDVSW